MALGNIIGGITSGVADAYKMKQQVEREKEDREFRKNILDIMRRQLPRTPSYSEGTTVREPPGAPSDEGLYVEGSGRKGGRVKRTGIYRLHAGEVVLPRKLASRMSRHVRRASWRSSGRR